MVDDATLSVGATQTRAGVDAALVDAGHGTGAVRVQNTLRFTALDSVSEKVR